MSRRRGGSGGWLSRAGSPPELASAVVGAVLVFGAIGYMLEEAITDPNTPPIVTIAVDSVLARGDGFLVEFTATNRGGSTAAALQIEGELFDDSVSIERSETVLSYLPEGASRIAGMFFVRDPRRYRLELRPRGYERP